DGVDLPFVGPQHGRHAALALELQATARRRLFLSHGGYHGDAVGGIAAHDLGVTSAGMFTAILATSADAAVGAAVRVADGLVIHGTPRPRLPLTKVLDQSKNGSGWSTDHHVALDVPVVWQQQSNTHQQ